MLNWESLPEDLDLAWQDADLETALVAFHRQDPEPALKLLAATPADPHRREVCVDVLAGVGQHQLPQLWPLVEEAPEDGNRWLLLAASLSVASWTARGADVAERTTADQVGAMLRLGDDARQALRRATELSPDDAVPWAVWQTCAHAAPQDRAELDHVFSQVVQRTPDLYGANLRRLNVLTRKWYGERDEALTFARERTAALPPGHPLWALIPSAHLEEWIYGQMGGTAVGRIWRSIRQATNKKVLAEVHAASDRMLDGTSAFANHPSALSAHQMFATYYHLVEDTDRLRRHLMLSGPRPDTWPWGYFGDTRETFARARAAAGLSR